MPVLRHRHKVVLILGKARTRKLRRNTKVAKRFFKNLIKQFGEPQAVVTNKLLGIANRPDFSI